MIAGGQSEQQVDVQNIGTQSACLCLSVHFLASPMPTLPGLDLFRLTYFNKLTCTYSSMPACDEGRKA